MKPRLLIVDDIQAVRHQLENELRPYFAFIRSVATAAEALQICSSEGVDFVLMDLVMPNVSGIDATRQICALEHPPKVVVLSGLHEESVVAAALEAGACDYLVKPVESTRICEVLLALHSKAA